MTELNLTEADTVQWPIVRHAAEIGWTAIPPKIAKHKRGGEAELGPHKPAYTINAPSSTTSSRLYCIN